jgi:hypothetical protein
MHEDRLLQVIEPLVRWLDKLQINEVRLILDESSTDKLAYSVDHPLRGKVRCNIPREQDFPVRVEGVGVDRVCSESAERDRISTLSCYDYGAVFDPIDGFVPGDHYGTSHYALAYTGLVSRGIRSDFGVIERALDFQGRTGSQYAFSKAEPHWEFNNYAWLETSEILSRIGEHDLANRIQNYLLSAPRHIRPFATNWKAMLGHLLIRLGRQTARPHLYLLGRFYRYQVFRAVDHGGSIADIKGLALSRPKGKSYSLQYHLYTAALLARHALVRADSQSRQGALKAAVYASELMDPDGDCNFKGRGQRQIFGYASAIYLFVACAKLEPMRAEFWLGQAGRVFKYLSGWQRKDGSFPLVLHEFPDDMHIGWHDYHHLTVYNAFVAAWLSLALLDLQSTTERIGHTEPKQMSGKQLWYDRPSGTLVARTSAYHICVSKGETYYETDCGFTPHHIWITGMGTICSCPGGPDSDRYGERYRQPGMDWNFFAPLPVAHGSVLATPARLDHGHFVQEDRNVYRQSTTYGGWYIVRTWTFRDRDFETVDQVWGDSSSSEIVLVNIPLLCSCIALIPRGEMQWGIVTRLNGSPELVVDVESDLPLKLELKDAVPLTAGWTTFVRSRPVMLPAKSIARVRYRWQVTP